ncbi:MAG: glycosyltransferase family 39 protein [Acidimicrobiales bacterium]
MPRYATIDQPNRAILAGRPLVAFDRRALWVAATLFAVLMVLSPFYGFDRDELYFLDCARHLQASYVDQPVLTPLLARISLSLFGVSLPALRLWPALAGASTVVVGALTARELGGGKRAQFLAALGTATMPSLLAIDHLMGPTSLDMLAWAGLALVVLRIGRTGDTRWWLVAGTILGLGLANKHSIGFFALALFFGILLSKGRGLLFNRWLLGGVAIAIMFTIPDLWWQSTHGWATIAMTRQLNAENGGVGKIGTWVAGQLLMTSLVLIPVWVGGLRALWRSGEPVRRSLVWAYGLLFVFFAVTTGGKIYYLAGAYVPLLAAGFVAMDASLSARPTRVSKLIVGVALTTLAALPLVLPVLPAADIGWTYAINQTPGESIGWPELVGAVRTAWYDLPDSQRAHAVIVGADYGEVGAINELGRDDGLPTALGDQNSEWWWGPGSDKTTTVLAVAPGPRDVTDYRAYLEHYFRSVRVFATLHDHAGIHNQEWGGHIYLCTGLRRSWPATWRQLRHYD